MEFIHWILSLVIGNLILQLLLCGLALSAIAGLIYVALKMGDKPVQKWVWSVICALTLIGSVHASGSPDIGTGIFAVLFMSVVILLPCCVCGSRHGLERARESYENTAHGFRSEQKRKLKKAELKAAGTSLLPVWFAIPTAVVIALLSIFLGINDRSSSSKELAAKAAYAQEIHFAEHGAYTDDLENLSDIDEGLNSKRIRLSVTEDGENSYFTVDAKLSETSKDGFGIQGNRNGVIATCKSSVGCDDNEWNLSDVSTKTLIERDLYPLSPTGVQGVGQDLQQIPVDQACTVHENPYVKSSPRSNPMREGVCRALFEVKR